MRPSILRRLFRRVASTAVLGLLAATLSTTTAQARPAVAPAGGLQQVTGFGSNPGNLQMYEYTPAGLPANAPLVVALHGCAQTADAYYTNSGWPELADRWGFDVVFPQTTAANNALSCFSWFDPAKDTRGRGEAASIVQMVEHAKLSRGSDTGRVYVTGLSAGGGMTADLLAAYPDVFAGGSVASGLPAQCATSQAAASGCQTGPQKLTPPSGATRSAAAIPATAGPGPGWRSGRAPRTTPCTRPTPRPCATSGRTCGASVRHRPRQTRSPATPRAASTTTPPDGRRDVLRLRHGPRPSGEPRYGGGAVREGGRVLPEHDLLVVLHGRLLGPGRLHPGRWR